MAYLTQEFLFHLCDRGTSLSVKFSFVTLTSPTYNVWLRYRANVYRIANLLRFAFITERGNKV